MSIKTENQKAIETQLNTVNVQTRLDQETAQKAVTNEQARQIKLETIELLLNDFSNSIKELSGQKYQAKEHKTKFGKDFEKNESEYKGVFALFNALTKGKSNNAVNQSFFENKLDKKYRHGKDFNGITLLACLPAGDLIGQMNNPQKFTTSQFKRALKTFNTYVKSFETFEAVNERAKLINELIKSYKDAQIDALGFIETLDGLKFYENQKSGLVNGLSESAKIKVSKRVYTLINKES